MQKIPLSNERTALVDEADLVYLSQWKWSAGCFNGRWYAFRNSRVAEGLPRRIVLMHRVLCSGKEIDHRDGDGLNNQRENLRSVSHAHNIFNQNRKSTKVRGVRKRKDCNRWEAGITFNCRLQYLGLFATFEEALNARLRAEQERIENES